MKLEDICGVKTPRLIYTGTIDEIPGPYCMSFGFDPDALALSIEKIGLVHPLIITKSNNDNKYKIVAGYRRLIALKKLKRKNWQRKC